MFMGVMLNFQLRKLPRLSLGLPRHQTTHLDIMNTMVCILYKTFYKLMNSKV